ncbi:hypothetical protein Ancab_011957 [Ancistrocladus abbreviatus]
MGKSRGERRVILSSSGAIQTTCAAPSRWRNFNLVAVVSVEILARRQRDGMEGREQRKLMCLKLEEVDEEEDDVQGGDREYETARVAVEAERHSDDAIGQTSLQPSSLSQRREKIMAAAPRGFKVSDAPTDFEMGTKR